MSISGISFSGLSSGIDSASVIKQLLSLGQRPVQALQRQQQQIQQHEVAINQAAAAIAGFQAAASALDSNTSFELVQASTGDSTVAAATAAAGAQTGSHSLQITQLAQAQRIGSSSFSSQTNALSLAGQIVINGKAVSVSATDSLQAIAANINSARAGVNATIVSPSANAYTLVLSSVKAGASNKIQIADAGGGVILSAGLGLLGPTASVREPITNGANSSLFTDSSSSIGSLLGLSSPAAGAIQINGTAVTIDLAVDSLTSVAGKINAAGIAGVSASITAVADPSGGPTRQQLKITGASTPAFTDSSNVLTNLGILQRAPATELAVAKDAAFVLDGINMTRSSNSVSDAISGVTLNLLKDAGAPSTTVNITPDMSAIKRNITTFVNQYNQVAGTIGKLSQYDPDKQVGGPLFGDVTMQSVLDSLTSIMTDSVAGLSAQKATLAQIGIKLDQTGQLNISESDLDAALNTNLTEVARIFRAVGVATDSSITFLSSTEKTKASTSAGYTVNISQLATQATLTAGTAHTIDNNAATEVLTFTGGQFGASGKTLLINPSSTMDGIVSQINGDSTIGAAVTASNVGGKLQVTAKQYGSAYNFTLASSQAAANNNSGIGTTAVSGTGVDVAGSINGETATGRGQFLTGNAGNARTDGLQIRVTSTTAGSKGTLTFTQGIASQIRYLANRTTDFVTGTLTLYTRSLDTQMKDIGDSIKNLQARLKDQEERLRLQFSAMEDAVSKIKAAGAGLAALSTPIK